MQNTERNRVHDRSSTLQQARYSVLNDDDNNRKFATLRTATTTTAAAAAVRFETPYGKAAA